MTHTTLTRPIIIRPLHTNFNDESTEINSNKGITKIVFIPEGLTPLDVYEAELVKAGYSKKSIKETIEGLKESPLYEGQAS